MSNQKITEVTEVKSSIGYYRVLGNNMPQLHAENQALINLKHILDHESNFDNVDKFFVLNRIVSKRERDEIISLLKKKSVNYEIIDFDLNEFLKTGYNLGNIPSPIWWFSEKSNWESICAQTAIRVNKNLYLMNNNGARNFCLEHGLQKKYEWIMPWDGNCFLSDFQAKELFDKFSMPGKCKYISTPMERAQSNADVHAKAIAKNAVEEPQISFHKSAKERFNEKRPYGNQPKVELFKRLGYKGVWDQWLKDYPWRKFSCEKSSDAGLLDVSSSVFRLFSGNLQAIKEPNTRSHTRGNSIADFIDSIEADYFAKQPLKERLLDLLFVKKNLFESIPGFDIYLSNRTQYNESLVNKSGANLAVSVLIKLINSIFLDAYKEVVRSKIDAFVLLNSNVNENKSELFLVELVYKHVLHAVVESGALNIDRPSTISQANRLYQLGYYRESLNIYESIKEKSEIGKFLELNIELCKRNINKQNSGVDIILRDAV